MKRNRKIISFSLLGITAGIVIALGACGLSQQQEGALSGNGGALSTATGEELTSEQLQSQEQEKAEKESLAAVQKEEERQANIEKWLSESGRKTIKAGLLAAAEFGMETYLEAEPKIELVMVGDMLMHLRVTNSGKQEDGSLNYDHIFAPVKDLIEGADIAIGNQEVMLGGPDLGYSGYPRFNTAYEFGDALVEAGFDVMLHSTNHSVDKGKEGAMNCLNYWKENHPQMGVVGLYGSQEERDTIYVYEKDGIRVAILNYTYGTNGLPVPSDMPFLVNLMTESLIKKDIKAAKEVADFVIICPHWGTEYVHYATKNQKNWAKFFMECGADLCIGTHPHVIEPVEWIENDEGDKMLVYYSLGNFVNSTASNKIGVANRMLGAMATVTIAKNRKDGTVYIKEYGAEPLVTFVPNSGKGIATMHLEDFTDELALKSMTYQKDPNFSVDFLQQLWQEVMGNLPN